MYGLDELIWPITRRAFEQEYWERQPLVVRREQRDYYDALLSLSDMDEILSLTSLYTPQLRLLVDGKVVLLTDLQGHGLFQHVSALDRLYAEFGRGATVNLVAIHERWKPLRDLCRTLSKQLSAALQVNAYLTPPSSRGLKPHYDTHDVLVLQTYGVKRWRVFEEFVALPLRGDMPNEEIRGEDAEDAAYREFDLYPGEMMYLPRGWKHVAWTQDSTSLHLTVGLFPLTWATVLLNAVEAVIATDRAFREALPMGFAVDTFDLSPVIARFVELADSMRERMPAEAVIARAADGARLSTPPYLDGHLMDMASVSLVGQDTLLRARDPSACRLSVENESAILAFSGKKVTFPGHIATQLHYIINVTGEFTAAALPGALDTSGRLVLVHRLVKEGFLTVLPGQMS